jgi:hypothetical protein
MSGSATHNTEDLANPAIVGGLAAAVAKDLFPGLPATVVWGIGTGAGLAYGAMSHLTFGVGDLGDVSLGMAQGDPGYGGGIY